MIRPFLSLCAAGIFGVLLTPLSAANSSVAQEIHELRRDLQMQGRKIEALTDKIADLTTVIKQREEAKPAPAPAPPVPIAVAPPAEGAKPTAETPTAAPKAAPVPLPPTISHVVAKGETLTGIAKQYNVNLSDLLKLNKNTNERKLQIGQTLKVPAVNPAEATPVTP